MDAVTHCDALKSGRRLEARYHGFNRVVEVHTCGVTTANNKAMRVWQVRGGSVSNEPVGWKVLLLDEIQSYAILQEPSNAPRHGYKQGDKLFARIICQL